MNENTSKPSSKTLSQHSISPQPSPEDRRSRERAPLVKEHSAILDSYQARYADLLPPAPRAIPAQTEAPAQAVQMSKMARLDRFSPAMQKAIKDYDL